MNIYCHLLIHLFTYFIYFIDIILSRDARKQSSGFWTRSYINRPVQPQKMARNLKFRKKRGCTIRVAKTKALISFAVTVKLICAFVFAWAKVWFFHDAALITMYYYFIIIITCIIIIIIFIIFKQLMKNNVDLCLYVKKKKSAYFFFIFFFIPPPPPKLSLFSAEVYVYTPGIYEVYRGYIVFVFSVKMFVCVRVCKLFLSKISLFIPPAYTKYIGGI